MSDLLRQLAELPSETWSALGGGIAMALLAALAMFRGRKSGAAGDVPTAPATSPSDILAALARAERMLLEVRGDVDVIRAILEERRG